MNTQNKDDLQPSREQIIYANLLIIGVWAGIIILVATYAIYVSGVLPAHVDMSAIPKLWGKGVSEYLAMTHSPHGWGWAALLTKGDFLNYLGFACYLVLVRGYSRQKDWMYAAIAVLEIVVLSVAASGILGAGGH
jgi:hypothetical protein